MVELNRYTNTYPHCMYLVVYTQIQLQIDIKGSNLEKKTYPDTNTNQKRNKQEETEDEERREKTTR